MYVKTEMNPAELKMKSKFTDQVWCKVKINNGEDLLIGVCYRSPNTALFGKDNDNFLHDLIHEVLK